MQKNNQYRSYYYEGPYYHFGRNCGTYKGITMATSPEKALANLAFRCKKEKGYTFDAAITLNPAYLRVA